MKTLFRHILRAQGALILIIFFLNTNPSMATNTWVGGVSGSWSNSMNWNPQFVPGATDDVVVPFLAEGFSYPVIDAPYSIKSLSLASLAQVFGKTGGELTVMGNTYVGGRITGNGANMIFKGDVTGTGTLDGGNGTIYIAGDMTLTAYVDSVSTVILDGSALQHLRAYTFYNLVINNSGPGIILIGGPTATNMITMTSGNIQLNNHQLTLGWDATRPGTLVWNSGFMVGPMGSFRRWFSTATVAMGTTAGLFPMGTATANRFLWVSSTPIVGGWIALSHVDSNARTFFNPSYVESTGGLGSLLVNVRYGAKWIMQTDSIIANGIAMRIQGSSIPGVNDITRLTMSLANSAAPGMFAMPTGDISNPQVNRVLLTAANLNNAFYVASDSSINPLPVTMLSFMAAYNSGSVNLEWKTASEINNSRFEIQRSTDAFSWENIGSVEGHGNSQITNSYRFTDPLTGLAAGGTVFYRLKQVDFNDKYGYSEVRTVDINNISASINVFPNPTVDVINVKWVAENNQNSDLRVMDLAGQQIYHEIVTGEGAVSKQLDLSSYKPGAYMVEIITAGNTTSKVVYKR